VDQRAAVLFTKVIPRLCRFQHLVHGGQLRPAGSKLRGELSKLRVYLRAQFVHCQLQPIVCGNLFGLTGMHGLEVGQDDVGKQPGEGIDGLIHKEILNANPKNRLITNSSAMVMRSVEAQPL
jgi:hypothetical protein